MERFLRIRTFYEVLAAAHHSHLVESEFKGRGGIMFVAPPEQLKTSIIEESLESFPGALILTDLVSREMIQIRNEISAKRYTTLALPEFQKIYDRDERVAANLEGNLRALMEEGFSYSSGSSPDMQIAKARALVISGCTVSLYEKNFQRWKEQGFCRRMLVCRYVLHFPHLLSEAVLKWKKIRLNYQRRWLIPMEINIPHLVEPREAAIIQKWCNNQLGRVEPAVLLHKILSILRWRNRKLKRKDDSFEVLKDFSECLSRHGAEVEL